jgi:protein-S-isoprenylcysteine O-methyltransferase Ste14
MNTETTFQIAAILLILSAMSISIPFRHRAQKVGKQAGDQISARRDEKPLVFVMRAVFGLAFWLSTLAYLINPRWMAWAQLPLPPALRWSGALLGLLGLPLMYWVFSSLGNNVTHTTVIRREHSLVTYGPYRWVRHPLYTVAMLTFFGFILLSANWFIFLLAVITSTTIILRTPQEEARLVEKFGDEYRRYMAQTGRFLPRI